MARRWLTAMVAGLATIAVASALDRAIAAQVTVSINKSTQTMSVLLDGVEQHNWKVSTGLGGGPPSGAYRPQRLEKKWFSHKYGWSPMPNSIFFYEGYAIHGTIHVSRLGQRAPHGCVRLHPSNAAILYDLVRLNGKDNTRIVVSHTEHVAPRPPEPPKSETPSGAASVVPPAAIVLDIKPDAVGGTVPRPPAAVSSGP